MIFGQMIQAWREKYKISRRKLALRIGIDHVTLSRIENNETSAITLNTWSKITMWMHGVK
jgi:transcriptional regulator with XRE-family HTH domain